VGRLSALWKLTVPLPLGSFPLGLSEVFLLEIFSPFLAELKRKKFFQNSVKDAGVAGLGGEGDLNEKSQGGFSGWGGGR